ncbi:hypothetical protein TD95_005045 [Thielaviopsis punctulata]|uniref:ML-like domain-containing protein n=1 Tax=Thielaviopsis punctulata TaxID=72032 RepID=A0A0F4ZGW8_9PEZI|nr:hypothetical protein TD95_005045 [Thielaviopsis punctulata]
MTLRRFGIAALALLATPACAVQITFSNCLTDSYQKSNRLQFTPMVVDAAFDTDTSDHVFTMTVWGNVSGSSGSLDKITLESSNQKITNLKTKVNVLNYTPFQNASSFCARLENGSCPLGPVYNTHNK